MKFVTNYHSTTYSIANISETTTTIYALLLGLEKALFMMLRIISLKQS